VRPDGWAGRVCLNGNFILFYWAWLFSEGQEFMGKKEKEKEKEQEEEEMERKKKKKKKRKKMLGWAGQVFK